MDFSYPLERPIQMSAYQRRHYYMTYAAVYYQTRKMCRVRSGEIHPQLYINKYPVAIDDTCLLLGNSHPHQYVYPMSLQAAT